MIPISITKQHKAQQHCPFCGDTTERSTRESVRGCRHCGVTSYVDDGVAETKGFRELQATSKVDVIHEMVAALAAVNAFSKSDAEEVAAAVLQREAQASTGIGCGVAIPHARHPAATSLVGMIATSHAGIGFDSLDGQPVRRVILLVAPPEAAAAHIRALAAISRHLQSHWIPPTMSVGSKRTKAD